MNPTTSFHLQNNTDLIRESLFLKPDSIISPELVHLFAEAQYAQNFKGISALTENRHTDQFRIYFTHDIDWLSSHHPYSIVNYCRSLFSAHQWLRFHQLFQKDIFLRTIEQVLMIEKQTAITAIYHIGATNGNSLQRHGIRYNQSDTLYTELIALLQSYGQPIGLHSSYHAEAQQQIHAEQLQLKKYTGKPVLAHRSHFLHSRPASLYPQLAASGIRYEFGCGRAREVGLLNNFPGKYKPVDLPSGKVLDVTVIPLLLLDNVFFVKPYHEVLQAFRNTLQQVKQYNGSACILFHPENLLLKPQLWNYFEEIIHICKHEGAVCNPSL